MKTTIQLSLFVLGVLFVCTSCKEKEPPKEVAYYRFTPADYQRLLPYKEGQVLKFRNQNGEERTISVHRISTTKKQSNAYHYYYYDSKEIVLVNDDAKEIDSIRARFVLLFYRYPSDKLAEKDIYTEYPSKFSAAFRLSLFWNGNPIILMDYDQEKIEMTVNGKTYRNVFVFYSYYDKILEIPCLDETNGEIYYIIVSVNVIYYDEFEGIIGFDDLKDNGQWRLIK